MLVSPRLAFEVLRSQLHGHVAAVVGPLRRLGLARRSHRRQDLPVTLIVARLLECRSKLATARGFHAQTASSSLAEADEDALCDALEWLLSRQSAIERALAKRHLGEGSLMLYDLTSTDFEGRHCPLASHGYSRDERLGKLQIVFGLVADSEGCPLAVELFEGGVADPATMAAQVDKPPRRFGLQRAVLIGDRGMLPAARVVEDLRPHSGVAWITALKSVEIRKLVADEALQMSLFDERDLAEITYPGERLIACYNLLLAEKRKRKRGELLAAAEKKPATVRRAKAPLHGVEKTALRVGKLLGRTKMSNHCRLVNRGRSFFLAMGSRRHPSRRC